MPIFMQTCNRCGQGDEFCRCSPMEQVTFMREEDQRKSLSRIATALEKLVVMASARKLGVDTNQALAALATGLLEPNCIQTGEPANLLLEAADSSTAKEGESKEEKKCKQRVRRKR